MKIPIDMDTDLEILRQRYHDLVRKLSLGKSETDYIRNELGSLQTKRTINEKRIGECKKGIESELALKWIEQINGLRHELVEMKKSSEKSILKLEEELAVINVEEISQEDMAQCDKWIEQINQTITKQAVLEQEADSLKLSIKHREEENLTLSEKIKVLHLEFDKQREMLASEKEAQLESKESLELILEEKAMITSELATLRTRPVSNPSDGTSLFAEVYDERKILTDNIALLKQKLVKSRAQLCGKETENHQLSQENDRLRHKLRDETEWTPEQLQHLEASKAKVRFSAPTEPYQCLEFIEDSLKEQERQNSNIPEGDTHRLEWAYSVLQRARDKVKDSLVEFNTVSHEREIIKEQLSASQAHIKNLNAKLAETELKLEQAKDRGSVSDVHVNQDPSLNNGGSAKIKTSKTVRFAGNSEE